MSRRPLLTQAEKYNGSRAGMRPAVWPHRELLMNFINKLKNAFNAKKVDPVSIAIRDAFSLARCRYEQSQEAIRPYTARAKHRSAIFSARYRYDQTKDDDAYKKELAAYTDPDDFASYTEAELDAHTANMENHAAEFDNFTAAFVALNSTRSNPGDEFCVTARACFNVYCETYKIAVDAYKIAALAATVAAAEINSQAVKNDAKAWLFETIATDSGDSNRGAAAAKSAAFKVKANEEASRAKAKSAEAKAQLDG